MCKCTPSVAIPYCGKVGCTWPEENRKIQCPQCDNWDYPRAGWEGCHELKCLKCNHCWKVVIPLDEPIKRLDTQYIGTLPDGYEWRFILGDPLRIIGFNQTNGIKIYRVEEFKLVEEEKPFPEPVESPVFEDRLWKAPKL